DYYCQTWTPGIVLF
nr:immunoglobulin light chain junction region [Macaca mulatta]MOX19156.1 immunoglobulin light chain junction region [Macaca mulatta]MOX22298.1 immunoglobulin light chain junction region [Macaca mulatta]